MSEPSKPAITRPNTARLLISCPDRRGIVAAVSQFLFSHGANIIASDQHSTDPEGGRFFMRQEFFLEGLDLTKSQFERAFAEVVAEPFGMDWKLWYSSEPKRSFTSGWMGKTSRVVTSTAFQHFSKRV